MALFNFNDLGKKLTQTSQTAVEKTKVFTATTQLTLEINKIREQINESYKKIGEAYFLKYQDNPTEEFMELVEEIKQKYAEIEDKNAQIIELKGVIICPQCKAEVPVNTAFCSKCGCKIQNEVAAPEVTEDSECENETAEDSQEVVVEE